MASSEVLEITGIVDGTDCGTLNNEATVEFSGGPEPGSITAIADPVEVTGCPTPTPTPSASPSASASCFALTGGIGRPLEPGESKAEARETVDEGELPDTATGAPPPVAAFALAAVFMAAASVLVLRTRRRT